MPRPISTSVLERIGTAEDSLGISLARLCLRAGLPILYVSAMLGVTRMTLHTWYRGGGIHQSRHGKINTFMQMIENDIQAGVLPKQSLNETKKYAESFCGHPISSTNKKSG